MLPIAEELCYWFMIGICTKQFGVLSITIGEGMRVCVYVCACVPEMKA